MTMAEIIRHRRSVRTFDGKGITQEHLKQVMDFTLSVENPYQIPITWKILPAKEYKLSSPVIVGAEFFIAGKIAHVPHAEEAFGYAFEKILLFAESLGLGSTWIGGTMDRQAFEKAMDLKEGELMPCMSPLGHPAEKMSMRESLMRKGVKADSRMEFEELFYQGDFEHPLRKEQAGECEKVLEMVQWAPSAVNKQPWRLVLTDSGVHFYEKHSKGYISADGQDMQKIDMGIAMYHFAAMMEEAGKQVTCTVSDPQIAVEGDVEYIATLSVR